jgi:hypothetical protein
MIEPTLAFMMPGPAEILLILIIFAIPVLLIVLTVRYVLRSNNENRRLRLEVGKLADELEQARKQNKGENNNNPSPGTG